MKSKIQIKEWITREILFEYEKENNTIKDTLEEAVKRGVKLWRANLVATDLMGANLQKANLRGANFRGANMEGVDFSGADLRDVIFWGTHLERTDFSGTNVQGMVFRQIDLASAKNIDSDQTDYWWHIHETILYEWLTEPIRARINYIKKNKPKEEVGIRLKLLKPVLGDIPTTEDGWKKLHKKECLKDCPWNGKSIFPNK